LAKRTFYGWFDQKKREYRLSSYPADAPVRPSLSFDERASLEEYVLKKRGNVMWWPPLPLEA